MRFTKKVSNGMTIKLPASVVQHMKIQPGDLLNVSIDFSMITAIANTDKFTDFCKKLGQEKLSHLYREYHDTGGMKTHGSYRTWLVKRLDLKKHGLEYWTGNDSLTDILEVVEDKKDKGGKKDE